VYFLSCKLNVRVLKGTLPAFPNHRSPQPKYLLLSTKGIPSLCGQLPKTKQSRYTPCWRSEGEEVQLLLILDFGTRGGEWSGLRLGRALPPGKGLPVPIGQEAGWGSEPF
jgi:hypothetical protein